MWHFVSQVGGAAAATATALQALIFLVLLEYSFVSYFMTRGSLNCTHRLSAGRQTRSSSQHVQGAVTAEDLRVRLLTNNNNNAPVKGVECLRQDSVEVPRVRRTHSSLDRDSAAGAQKTNKSFSVATGVEQCIQNTAVSGAECSAGTVPGRVLTDRLTDCTRALHCTL